VLVVAYWCVGEMSLMAVGVLVVCWWCVGDVYNVFADT
jgi:hypothetical protein